MTDEAKNNIPVGVFLIGLAGLVMTHHWWPGILFLVAIYMITKGIVNDDFYSRLLPAAILTAIGVSTYIDFAHFKMRYLWSGLFLVLGILYLSTAFKKSS
tara:strand:+ start:115781 stop:116080 length:300 start_codon:yes stop_codon:yes gene_type:complete